MKTASKIKTTPYMNIPKKNPPKNEEDFSEVKRTSKGRHILCASTTTVVVLVVLVLIQFLAA